MEREHDTAAVVSDPVAQRRLTMLLATCIFFSVLNGTMFNVSIPDIARQFGLLPSRVSWVVSGYIVVFAIASVTYGRLADSYSVKNLITTGLVLFNAGSILGFLSERYPVLIFGRIIQASGSGAIPALAMMIATRFFPGEIRGRVLGVIASTVAFGGGIGPILGGFITGAFHWRYLFILSIVTLLTIPQLRRHLPAAAAHSRGFDASGALLMAGAVASLLLFITLSVWWLLPVCLALMRWFVVHINRIQHPFVNPSLFHNTRYRGMILTGFLAVGTIFGMMFMTPLMLRDINGLGTEKIGLVMFPGAMSAAVMGTIGGRLVDRKGNVPVVFMGLAFLATGFVLLSVIAGSKPWVVSLNLIVCYIGFSLLQPSLAHTASSTLPKEFLGIGMGMYNLFFFTSGAFSAAFIGRMLDAAKGRPAINPLSSSPAAGPYSNICMLLAFVVLCAAAVFHFTFRSKKQPEES